MIRRVETYQDAIVEAHKVLGLSVFAEPGEIKRAWRARANATHPDHGGNAAAFQAVQVAAEILLVEGAREYYEAELRRAAARSSATQPPPPPTSRPQPLVPESTSPGGKTKRRPWLLVAAMFGYLVAPHLHPLGLAGLPLRDFYGVMQSLAGLFLVAWCFVKK